MQAATVQAEYKDKNILMAQDYMFCAIYNKNIFRGNKMNIKKIIIVATVLTFLCMTGCAKDDYTGYYSEPSYEYESTLETEQDLESSSEVEIIEEIETETTDVESETDVVSSEQNQTTQSVPVEEPQTVKYGQEFVGSWSDNNNENGHTYWVAILSISDNSAQISIGYIGFNLSPIYEVSPLNVQLNNGEGDFVWEDSWFNKGTGHLRLIKDANGDKVGITMKVTEESDVNRASLETNGEKILIYKG